MQASQAFADAAKRDPRRFLALLPRFKPTTSHRPVDAAIQALAEVVALPELEAAIHDLISLGFFGPDHRADVAWALSRAARGDTPMGDYTCAVLESWLVDDTSLDSDSKRERNAGGTDSLLFGMRGGGFLPGGNFPVLQALTNGHLLRPAPRANEWVAILERHLMRSENSRVWEALASQLEYVLVVDATRATAFFDLLFSRFPRVLGSREGLSIVARAMPLLHESAISRWMSQLERSVWVRRKQAYGELLVLLATKPEGPAWARARLEQELEALHRGEWSEVVLGLAHSAARLWTVQARRQAASEILVRIVPHARDATAEAAMSVFHRVETLVWDHATQRLLEALRDSPAVLAAERGFFAEAVRDVLHAAPELVADVALVFVREVTKRDSRGSLFSHGPELVDIAMTLQRLQGTVRAKGLDLFEALLEANTYGAREVLAELDPGPGTRAIPRARAPRARRRPRR